MVSLGIDLGTTFSGAASIVNGNVVHISHETGREFLESMVKFIGDTYVVGALDGNLEDFNEPCVVFDSKRMIGRKFSDSQVQRMISDWPFTVTSVDDEIQITVSDGTGTRNYTPVQISALILKRLKEMAERQLGEPVVSTVVTIPARFGNAQRKATRDACKLAGLPKCSLLQEPTAAAIAYIDTDNVPVGKMILVYDLGGGTFDVSIVVKTENGFEVKHTLGDTALGGRDFDQRLVSLLREKFQRKHSKQLPRDPHTNNALLSRCVKAKMQLSHLMRSKVILGSLSLSEEITRAEFENCNRDLFARTIQLIDDLFREYNLTKEQIYKVVVVGGSTRIPKIHNLLSEYFGEERITHQIHPDRAVVEGAAKHAENLTRPREEQLSRLIVKDINPLDLGVESADGRMVPIIGRETTVPAEGLHYATTVSNNQTDMQIKVYEGNDPIARNNLLVGKFTLSNLPALPARKVLVCITFRYTEESIVEVIADCVSNGVSRVVKIDLPSERRRVAERDRQQADLNRLQYGNVPHRERDPTIEELETEVHRNMHDPTASDLLKHVCQSILQWIRTSNTFTVADIYDKLNRIEAAKLPPILLPA
ncbi:unnamed protein product [Echinostoma caproni]|uniref:Heat shock protein 70 n=1 Tax=Echinostoma caproni TaxID=27848 RepID=A0A183BBS8_9TREM|nr:unnamed protein product [Echinostoma caproni]